MAREKAEQAHIKKSQYLKACSHDLMQPLEAARLFTSALSSQNNLTSDQKRQVANIDHSLKVANDLLADLGEIARIESGNMKAHLSEFQLQELFNELANEFSEMAKERGVDFRVVDTHVWVKSDRHMLHRILQNLVGNAFRYASPGIVLLGARTKKETIHIQVLDNGPGIPKEKQDFVFEQFTQLSAPQSSNSGRGLGLGLSITQSLSQILSHPLHLESEPDKGCKFSIELPRVAAHQHLATSAAPKAIGFHDITVMCIDNDPDVLHGMIELLTAWHCNVIAADSYKEALTLYEQHQADIEILLVDYQLENNLNGLD